MKWFLNLFRIKRQDVKHQDVNNSYKENHSLTLYEKYPMWDSKQCHLYV
jgi:hypothetical protein